MEGSRNGGHGDPGGFGELQPDVLGVVPRNDHIFSRIPLLGSSAAEVAMVCRICGSIKSCQIPLRYLTLRVQAVLGQE